MKEEVLKRFFLGHIGAEELAKDVSGSRKSLGPLHSAICIEDMEEQLTITRPMLIMLCDAVLSGHLFPDALAIIGFALEASDHFEWDGDEDEVLANVIADWSCPEVNYPLTIENVNRFRQWLDGSEPYPQSPSASVQHSGEVITVVEKRLLKS